MIARSKRRGRPVCFLLALCVSLAPRAGLAQSASPQTPAEREVDKRYREGLEAVAKGDAETARLKFLQAYATSKRTDALWNLAMVELDADQPVAAAEHLRAFLADSRGDAASKAKAKEILESELWPLLGHVRVLGPSGTLVTLDHERTLAANEIADVAPGKHVIEGAGGPRREVSVAAGARIDVRFGPEASAVAAPTVPTVPTVPPAPRANDPAPADAGKPPFWTTGRYLGAGALAAGGAAVVAAIGFTVAANGKASELADARSENGVSACFRTSSPACSSRSDLADARDRNSNLAVGLWIGAGALVAGGAALLVLAKPQERANVGRPLVVPAVSHEGARIDFRLRF
ncbi:hypothetical protein [Pendulispora albinea]|uniref:Tetratricopeptide repeat protein n=1 Tax=Pendulispora albinea TaxID=2741071 RepID=A0ABZ2MBI8_9BACT